MTRLQNAEKQLIDALAALESAVESSTEASASSVIVATPSKVDFDVLIDEVSGIEAKLGEAMNTAQPLLDPDYKSKEIQDWQRWRDVAIACYECASLARRGITLTA